MTVSHPETWTCVVCGATNVHGANRWARVKAYALGWYLTRDDELAFCPTHCPPFAANYRPPEAR